MYQVGGDHYSNKAIEPIEFIEKHNLPFSYGNIVKYLTRWKEKGGVQDLKKARQYIEFIEKYNVEIKTRAEFLEDLRDYVKANSLDSEVYYVLGHIYMSVGNVPISMSEKERVDSLSMAKEILDEMIERHIENNNEVGNPIDQLFNTMSLMFSPIDKEELEKRYKVRQFLFKELDEYLKEEMSRTKMSDYGFAEKFRQSVISHIMDYYSINSYVTGMSIDALAYHKRPFSDIHENHNFYRTCLDEIKNYLKDFCPAYDKIIKGVEVNVRDQMIHQVCFDWANSLLFIDLDRGFKSHLKNNLRTFSEEQLILVQSETKLKVVKDMVTDRIAELNSQTQQKGSRLECRTIKNTNKQVPKTKGIKI